MIGCVCGVDGREEEGMGRGEGGGRRSNCGQLLDPRPFPAP